ncbi:MAG: GGDEF domain-containing protein [Lachnospiraceae bacterium]|nr:GGDEF domain-containing protein [Lachnospiraceae bacterium]
METKTLIELQKKGILLHRLVYVIFFFFRMILQFMSKDIKLQNTVWILSFLAFCWILEEVCCHNGYFNKLFVLQALRYVQCIFTIMMLCFISADDSLVIAMVAMLLMFFVDFFLTMRVNDKSTLISYMLYVSIPVLTVLVVKISVRHSNWWFFMFFNIILLLMVLFFEAFTFMDYMGAMDDMVFSQRNQLENIAERNEEILQMQDKLKNTNSALTIQKINLQNANRQIQMANDEMKAQTEILHYIANSFDVSKISNQITDAIMTVKKLDLCAVYIREKVYLNKHANYVIKTKNEKLDVGIKENISDIYQRMSECGEKEVNAHENIKENFPFLKDTDIQSIYIKVLCMDNDSYGLFMIGDSRPDMFSDNMSFYDAIIAQYDIAISNSKIYNEMQHMARKDGLTGINNRIYFNELFRKTIGEIQKKDSCISAALFDIDKFKNVNDTYGHLAGDEVIKRIATVTEECIDKYEGFVCRYGGEEFVVALPGRNLEAAKPVITELFEELCRQVVQYNEYEIHMSVSVGLTSYPEVCKNPEDLLKRSDWCMYYAKEHGRHQICVDDGSIERE